MHISLVCRLGADECAIVDFKSMDRGQEADVSRDQLHGYAAGHQKRSGENVDLVRCAT